MGKKRKIAWCCFTVIVLVPGLVLLGFHSKAGSVAASNTPHRKTVAQNTSAGMVTLAFDDGYASQYKYGLPVVDAAGLKSTQYIITGSIGQPGYMTQEEVLAMQANGHEIGAHTRTHPHLSEVTPAQLKDEISGSMHDLEALGIHATTFAYPYGDFNDKVVAAVKSAGFTGARTITDGLDAGTTPLLLKSKMVVADTNSKDINAWIDESQAKGTWLIIDFHRIDEDGNPMSADHELVQETVDILLAEKVRVVTISEGLKILKLKP